MRALLYFFAVCLAFPPGCSGAEKQMETAPYIVEEIRGRKAYIVIPKAVLPEKGFPAAILLHGRGQTAGAWFGEGLLSNGDQKLFPPLLLENGIAVIAPDALEPFGKGIKQWNFFRTTTETSQDLVLFNDLFQWIRENKRIKFDLSRIYVIGISSGGFMASRLAHASPENWAGIVIVAAGDADSFPKIPSFPLDNKPLSREIASNHPPSLIIHGDKDRIVPFAYGEIYFQDLKKAGVNTEMLVMKEGGHQWPLQFHDIIVRWLNSQNKSESTNMESKDKFNLDATFDGQKITLQRGETFSLGLKGVPTAGYLWKIVEIDDKTLKILEEGQKILTKPKLVGGSSLFFWRFQSLQKGETRLVLKHFRPWEGADNAHKTFSLIIEIK